MLYRLQKGDIVQAGKVLSDAFQHDPVWNKLYDGETNINKRRRAHFEVPVRYCLKYGEVYATSKEMEGVIAWLPGKNADMTMWRLILSGAMGAATKIGLNVSKKMGTAFKQIAEDRHKNMDGSNYIYIFVVGVATEFQGKGFGRKLLDTAIERAKSESLLVYLETETEENVKMYEHLGFRMIKKVTLPVIELPMWEMVKKPEA
jgi:ribosomal protein S18 acetylase RimI-like enzyme